MPPLPAPPRPYPIYINLPCKVLVATRVKLSYKYVTVDLIKIIFVVFLWVLILSPYITLINVRYVNFCWNISMLPRHHETIFVFSHTVKSWVYVCTFLSLCEPCSSFFVIHKTLLTYFPSINTVVDFNKYLHSKIHRTLLNT